MYFSLRFRTFACPIATTSVNWTRGNLRHGVAASSLLSDCSRCIHPGWMQVEIIETAHWPTASCP